MEAAATEVDSSDAGPAPADADVAADAVDTADVDDTGAAVDAGDLAAGEALAAAGWTPELAERFVAAVEALSGRVGADEDADGGAPAGAEPTPQPFPIPTGSGRRPPIDPERLSPEVKIRIGIREQGLGIRRGHSG